MKRSELQSKVVKKAMADKSFRDEFLKAPKATVEKEFGFKLASGMNVSVVEEDADTISIILPKNGSELSDSELDNVAGGCFAYCDLCPKDFDVF